MAKSLVSLCAVFPLLWRCSSFQVPGKATHWSGPGCPTLPPPPGGPGGPPVNNTQSADCPFLNIWTKPQVGEKKKSVMVWIYGGGFNTGDSADPMYNGAVLASNQDVVVVVPHSMNYRTNIFGFPGRPHTDQNLGLLDQRLAVEWVRDNIKAFGGDKSRIVLFGQSAGATSVDFYSYAWRKDPIPLLIPPKATPQVDMALKNGFRCGTADAAKARYLDNVPVWRYHYSGTGIYSTIPIPGLGATHGADVKLVLQAQPAIDGPPNALAKIVQTAWASFAKAPSSGLTKFGWPKYDPNGKTLIRLGDNSGVQPEFTDATTYDHNCPPSLLL
ncbi:alpha/beta-hydrolase [Tothia fuscella]|uniref:Carboxylic ester hydrolase n=1 Tax=Tothia fuscella TaxID=1048955 RepID=A0A9P4NS38_9PEZI|nr:alpha/beta-hydrolase [Tothia fuscella]